MKERGLYRLLAARLLAAPARTAIFSTGILNLVQLGLIYPLNILATFYFVVIARLRTNTILDRLMVFYIFAGVLSIFVNLIPLLLQDIEGGSEMLPNALKSFLAFLTAVVYFSGHRFDPMQFLAASMVVILPISIAAFFHLSYLIVTGTVTDWYFLRASISWVSGWPQRWAAFLLIGYFYCLAFSLGRGTVFPKLLTLLFLTLLILSGTRSALFGMIFGSVVLAMYSKKSIFFVAGLMFCVSLVLILAPTDGLVALMRVDEVVAGITSGSLSDLNPESSVGYRVRELWPRIISSLADWRAIFGWGHVGVSYLPASFFAGTDIPVGEASAESQYMDILQRQGLAGFVLFLAILLVGIVQSYKLSRLAVDPLLSRFWLGSLAWQVAILFHGVTVETLRFPLFSLFYFVFLGMLSYQRSLQENRLIAVISEQKQNYMR